VFHGYPLILQAKNNRDANFEFGVGGCLNSHFMTCAWIPFDSYRHSTNEKHVKQIKVWPDLKENLFFHELGLLTRLICFTFVVVHCHAYPIISFLCICAFLVDWQDTFKLF
jgi:hypothetical protein